MNEMASVIADLVRAGTDPELVGRVAAVFASVTERNSVTRNSVTDVTPAAIRMRRMRERKSSEINVLDAEKAASVAVTESVTERNKGVTTDNILISSNIEIDKKERIVGSVTRKRNSYAEDFEAFWKAFPTDPGMSKSEASKAWIKLSEEDKADAIRAIPAFKIWASQQGANYRMVHGCRYLTQRRFDGFKAEAAKVETASTRVYVMSGTDGHGRMGCPFPRHQRQAGPARPARRLVV